MIERQVIVTWYTLAEKVPPENKLVVVTGEDGVLGVARYCGVRGWYTNRPNYFNVKAWCDLEAYGRKGGSI